MFLPGFTDAGLLPTGDYLLTLDGLRQSHLVIGSSSASANWDQPWRARLIDNLLSGEPSPHCGDEIEEGIDDS